MNLLIHKGLLASDKGMMSGKGMLISTTVVKGYYVDAIYGSDANDGLTPATAIKTLDAVNSLDLSGAIRKVLFKRGQTWEGTITVPNSGDITNPVIFGAYGTGAKPKILGSELITGWTLHSGNIYKATVADAVSQVFVDNSRMTSARYPKTGVFSITTVNSTTQFVSTSLNTSINYAGAKWIGRTNAWVMITKDVTTSVTNTLTLNSAPTEGLNVGEGFFLTNKLDFLTAPGEWYYDSATTTLYLYTPGGESPAEYEVRATTTATGLSLSGYDYVTVDGLDFLHYKTGVTTTAGANNIAIKNCEFTGIDGKGIDLAYTCSNWLIENNRLEGMNHYGIFGYTANTIIKDNVFKDIALFENLGISGMGQGITLESVAGKAIHIEGDDNTISYNDVQNIGYSGIAFYGANNIIEYNFVKNACMVKDDGGGIYTYGVNEANPINAGSIIRYNIVDGVLGNNIGISAEVSSHGIYLDNYSGGVTVTNNVVYHASGSCVFLHQGKENIVENNLLFDARYIVLTSDDTGINTIRNNTMYALNLVLMSGSIKQKMVAERLCSYVHLYSGNSYFNPYNTDDMFMDTQEWSDPTEDSYTFDQWQTQSGQDATSTYNSTALTATHTQRILYNVSKTAKIYYLNGAESVTDLAGNSITTSFTLQPFTGKIVKGVNLFLINDVNAAPAFESETIALYSGIDAAFKQDYIAEFDSMVVKKLKTALSITALNQYFDVLHRYCGESSAISLRDIANNRTATTSGTLAFTKFQGFTGDASTGYINWNFIPSTHAINAVLNSAAFAYYMNTLGAASTGIYGGLSTTADGGTANRIILSCPAAPSDVFAVNAGLSNVAFTSGVGLTTVNRVNSATHKVFYKGNEVATANVASTKLPNQELYMLARHEAAGTANYFGNDQVSFDYLAKGQTAEEMQAIDAIFAAYLAKINNRW